MAWTGCSDDNGAETPVPSDTLELSVETLAFDADGSVLEGGNEVTVTSSGEWRLGGRQLWCQPSSEQGVSGQTVTFTVEPNTEVQMREETFTFMCGGEERRLVVTQEAASEFELNGDSFELAAEGGEFKLRLESSSDTSWRFDGESTGFIRSRPAHRCRSSTLRPMPIRRATAARRGLSSRTPRATSAR